MPKRRTQDAIHVTMTDHWIQKRPAFKDSLSEAQQPYTGDIVPFYTAGERGLLQAARGIQRAQRERSSEAYAALPETSGNLAALGEALLREGNRPAARRTLEKALRVDRTHPVTLNALAVLHASEGRLDRALTLLDASRKANPDHPLTWLNLGVTWEAKGDRTRAAQCYREAIRLQPDFAEARHRLAAIEALP
jgi:tetratricopeptide (TPR) repeat protein